MERQGLRQMLRQAMRIVLISTVDGRGFIHDVDGP